MVTAAVLHPRAAPKDRPLRQHGVERRLHRSELILATSRASRKPRRFWGNPSRDDVAGLEVSEEPVDEFFEHLVRGTRRRRSTAVSSTACRPGGTGTTGLLALGLDLTPADSEMRAASAQPWARISATIDAPCSPGPRDLVGLGASLGSLGVVLLQGSLSLGLRLLGLLHAALDGCGTLAYIASIRTTPWRRSEDGEDDPMMISAGCGSGSAAGQPTPSAAFDENHVAFICRSNGVVGGQPAKTKTNDETEDASALVEGHW